MRLPCEGPMIYVIGSFYYCL